MVSRNKCIDCKTGRVSGGGEVAPRQPPQKQGLRNMLSPRLVAGPPKLVLERPGSYGRAAPDGSGNDEPVLGGPRTTADRRGLVGDSNRPDPRQ